MTVEDCPAFIVNAANVSVASVPPDRVKETVSPVRVWATAPSFLKVTVKLTDEVGHIVVGPTRFTLVIVISLFSCAVRFDSDKKKNKIGRYSLDFDKILFTFLF